MLIPIELCASEALVREELSLLYNNIRRRRGEDKGHENWSLMSDPENKFTL